MTPKRVDHTTQVTGSNAVYRREVFDQVSFDSSLRDGEDVALNHALRERGIRMLTVPDLSVRHEESKPAGAAFAWLFQSGRGASRQLRRYREIRMPDAVLAGWLASGAYAVSGLARGRPRAAAAPALYLLAAAGAHVHRAFEWEARRTPAFAGAVITDMALLATYFAGRVIGLLEAE